MRRWMIGIAALGLALALFVPMTRAQTEGAQPAAQDKAKAEADAYKAWYDANAAKDIPKAMELAKNYLKEFPSGRYADYLKKWIVGARGSMFNQAMQSKNNAEMISIGKEALADDPENIDYIYLLALNLRQNELFAAPPNFAHASEAADFSKRAIKLIEAGKVPAVVAKDKWNQNLTISWLYQNLAVIEANNKNADKALEYYKKAAELDPTSAFNFLACGSLHQVKYQAAVQKFQALPEADRQASEAEMKPEVKAALDEVNNQADAVIDCWARFIALTAANNPFGETRGKVEKALTDLYNYRHPDSADGLQKLIDQYRNSAPPSAPAANAASTKP